MKTKKKSFVAVLATLAVGTAAVAGLGFTVNANHGHIAHADTAAVTVAENAIDFGTNTVSLAAGVAQTFSLASNLVGTYGFEWVAGEATITISGVGTYTLNESNPTISVNLTSPTTTEVTFESATDVELQFSLTYSVDYTDLVVGSNSVALTANNALSCIIGSGVEGETAPAGYYTFTRTSGNARITLLVDGKEQTVVLNPINKTFTAYIITPSTTVIQISSSANTTFNFDIAYSETDPAATTNALTVGTQTVNANGDGIEYTFTSEEGGTYQLDCTDANAFVMVNTEYGAEQILWDYTEDKYVPYTFTLEAGGSVSFLFATNDWADGTYSVTVAKL